VFRGSRRPLTTSAPTKETPRPQPVFRGTRRPVDTPVEQENDEEAHESRSKKAFNVKDRSSNRITGPRRSFTTAPPPSTTEAPRTEETSPLTSVEKEAKIEQRNNLFKKLIRDRADEEIVSSTPASVPTTLAPNPSTTKMSPLENLFNIIKADRRPPEPVVTVVSSSSSSSSSVSTSVSTSRSSSSSTGSRRKTKVKKSVRAPQLHSLSPQERLVKKVQETLRNDNSEKYDVRDITRPTIPRKKVILRKRVNDENESLRKLPRIGRTFDPGSSKIKSVKVRVRRIEDLPTFPIVY